MREHVACIFLIAVAVGIAVAVAVAFYDPLSRVECGRLAPAARPLPQHSECLRLLIKSIKYV